jgi:hypothetical protein
MYSIDYGKYIHTSETKATEFKQPATSEPCVDISEVKQEKILIDTNLEHEIDTPKSANDKTCSFILRTGLRKGQLCLSKVKGRNQMYCDIYR